ncbi:segregation/condensation protein A [Jiangella aurantiaca]|uniref:Segregation and condensation protein A n=1 Tax=Jiangella aurantiaca TaxID=2530373 RepID=A0A4R5A1M5_9ACTN|nr:segregation/condensation protein A [Jiangella aurantiaca]
MGAGPPVTDATTLLIEPEQPEQDESSKFEVHLENFEGPFDLLLTLIAKHKLDVTEVALSQVTDEFIAYIKASDWDLDETSEFLVVAATLLDLKAARLLPSGEVEDEDDLALLEARDLLFARLLQYKAYKEVAGVLAARLADESLRFPRAVGLEERYASLLPEVVVGLGPEELAMLAAKVLTPKPPPLVGLAHLHQPRVSVREEALVVVDRLRRSRVLTFRTLTADCQTTLHVVARFLSLLELYREKAVAFEQVVALGELTVRWTGDDDEDVAVGDEFDEEGTVDAADAD